MKAFRIILLVLFALSLNVLSSNVAFGAWQIEDDEEEDFKELFRVDNDPDAPYHELNEGIYGFWKTTETFIIVIDFTNTQPIQSPYTESDVHWIPGPMDKDWGGVE